MNSQTEFLPFHAINEFMRPDFRLSVIRETLTSLATLPEDHSSRINRLTKKLVKVTGFRNSEKAPLVMKIIPLSNAFEKSPELVSAILAAWAELNDNLRSQVYDLLKMRGWPLLSDQQQMNLVELPQELLSSWPILPLHTDRTKLPGFLPYWPKGEEYEELYKQFTEIYPNTQVSIDKVSLMVVWLSLRLPYQMDETVLNLETTDNNQTSMSENNLNDPTNCDENGLDK